MSSIGLYAAFSDLGTEPFLSAALKASVNSEGLKLAADQLDSAISVPADLELVERVSQKARDRVDQKNAAFDTLVRIFTF